MKLAPLDVGLVAGYLGSVLLVGMGVMCVRRRRGVTPTSATMSEYFLGSRALPWWALAVADLSSYLDIAGTMINTALVYALGAQGFYVEIRGGLCLALAFQMALTGKLVRRSRVLTRAEWMKFRFGSKAQGRAARLATAVLQLVVAVVMISYFAVGAGKFVTEFLTMPTWLGMKQEFWGAALLMAVAMGYTVVNGFVGVVWTDVYQALFIFAAFIVVGVRGMRVTLPSEFDVWMPVTNGSFVPRHTTFAQWSSVVPLAKLGLPSEDSYAIYDAFWVALLVYMLRTCFGSAGGPQGGGLQTVLAQRSDRDVALQTSLAAVLMSLRWLFSGAAAVLAVQYTLGAGKGVPLDPERVLPVVASLLPTGVKGLVVSALLAAGMTTFDTTVNSAAAYWTHDVYRSFLHRGASKGQQLFQAMLCSVVLVVAGLFLSLYLTSINVVWGFVTMSVAGAMVWPMFLAWYWSRFNGWGFSAGTVAGLMAAVAHAALLDITAPETEYVAFGISSAAALVVSLPVTLATAPTPGASLRRFYLLTRPPGLWAPLSTSLIGSRRARLQTHEHRLDMVAVVVALVWQMSMYQGMLSLAFGAYRQAAITGGIWLASSAVLYPLWYRRLSDKVPTKLSSSSRHSKGDSRAISVPAYKDATLMDSPTDERSALLGDDSDSD